MKKILLSLILVSSFVSVAQAQLQYQEANEDLAAENIFPEENYESDLVAQNEEEELIDPAPAESQDDFYLEEEVYDDEVEYSE